MDRISFTVVLQTAADQVTTAHGILLDTSVPLVGAIGHAALANLYPARHRQRVKARTRKNPTSKYGPNAGKHPRTSQACTDQTQVMVMEEGLTARSDR